MVDNCIGNISHTIDRASLYWLNRDAGTHIRRVEKSNATQTEQNIDTLVQYVVSGFKSEEYLAINVLAIPYTPLHTIISSNLKNFVFSLQH